MNRTIVLQSAKPNKNNTQYSFITSDIFDEYKLYRSLDIENIHIFYEKIHNKYNYVKMFTIWGIYKPSRHTNDWLDDEMLHIKALNTFILFEEVLHKPFIEITNLIYKWKFFRIIKTNLHKELKTITDKLQNRKGKREKENEINTSKINVPKRIYYNYKDRKNSMLFKKGDIYKKEY